MHPILILLVAIIGPIIMFLLFKHADKIRNSMWWPLAALGWIFVSGNTIGAWFALMEKAGIELPPDETSVPIFFCIVLAVIAVVGYFNIYRPHRKYKKMGR